MEQPELGAVELKTTLGVLGPGGLLGPGLEGWRSRVRARLWAPGTAEACPRRR